MHARAAFVQEVDGEVSWGLLRAARSDPAVLALRISTGLVGLFLLEEKPPVRNGYIGPSGCLGQTRSSWFPPKLLV